MKKYKKSLEINILSLTLNEQKVFQALIDNADTPLKINQYTSIPRPTVYITLETLKKRNLVKRIKRSNKFYWHIVQEEEIESSIQSTKKYLLNHPEGRDEIGYKGNASVVIHKGKESLMLVVRTIFKNHKGERLYGLQGNKAVSAFEKFISLGNINEINRDIKKNHIIIHAILEKGWVYESAKKFGSEWAKHFEGRTTSVHEIPSLYMDYATEIWLFKNSVYILSLQEEMIIEIKNSNIVKMIKAIFSFVQDNTHNIDINRILRGVLGRD